MPPNSHSFTPTTSMTGAAGDDRMRQFVGQQRREEHHGTSAPAIQYAPGEWPGAVSGKVAARLHVNNHRITSTLQWTLSGNPATLPRVIPRPFETSIVLPDKTSR